MAVICYKTFRYRNDCFLRDLGDDDDDKMYIADDGGEEKNIAVSNLITQDVLGKMTTFFQKSFVCGRN